MSTDCSTFYSRLRAGYARADCSIENGLLLAVSGGADSVALLHATTQLWPDCKERMRVIHVNHRLRDGDSDHDAAFVEELAKEFEVPCEVVTLEKGSLQEKSDGSLEDAARKARYSNLLDAAQRLQFANVVTAHHMDDQAETVLHNVIRGSGLRGLRGMQWCRPLSESIRLARPMLEFQRRDILSYLAEMKLSYKTDDSNTDVRFTRNRIRQQLLPSLKKDFNESVDRNLVSLAAQAEQTTATLDALAKRILSTALLEQQPEACRLRRRELSEWPVEFVRHLLTVLWIQQEWPRQKMTSRHYARLADHICSGVDAQEDLPGRIRFQASDSTIRFTRTPSRQ